MNKLLKLIENNFAVLLIVVTVLAFFYPQTFLWGDGHGDEMLMTALFFGCLKIDFAEVFHLRENFGKMLIFVAINIILFPVLFYLCSFGIDQQTRIGLFLWLAASGAVVTPLLASFLGLKVLWPTVFVVLTSSLIPFTLPFLTQSLFGLSVNVSVSSMMLFLAKIVFVPGILAALFRYFSPKLVKKILPFSGTIGSIVILIFMGLLVAINQVFLGEHLFHLSTLPILFYLFLLGFLRFLVGYFVPAANKSERWTNSLMFGNPNNGLIILLAAEFFSPQVLFVLLLSEVPWVLSQSIFQKIVRKYFNK